MPAQLIDLLSQQNVFRAVNVSIVAYQQTSWGTSPLSVDICTDILWCDPPEQTATVQFIWAPSRLLPFLWVEGNNSRFTVTKFAYVCLFLEETGNTK